MLLNEGIDKNDGEDGDDDRRHLDASGHRHDIGVDHAFSRGACDEDISQSDLKDTVNAPALVYTALSRAKCNLFILNLGNVNYHSFFASHINKR